jgi:predicted kinase
MSTLIVMCGVPGCGKSTFAKQFAKTHKDVKIVSRDAIRFSMVKSNEEYFKHEKEVLKRFYGDIDAALKVYEYVIADATHLSRSSRNALFRHVNTKGIFVVGLWIETPLSTCLERNAGRSGRERVPNKVIKEAFKRKASPAKEERFDEMYFISTQANLATGSAHPTFYTIEEILLTI